MYVASVASTADGQPSASVAVELADAAVCDSARRDARRGRGRGHRPRGVGRGTHVVGHHMKPRTPTELCLA